MQTLGVSLNELTYGPPPGFPLLGIGFDPKSYHQVAGRRKLGVLGMKERAAAVGGSLEVRSQAGSGTEVTAAFNT